MIIGKHIIIECAGEHAHLSEQELESIMSRAALAAGASILSAHFHRFGPQKGVTGVLVLAESHITVHTWPEHDYSAFDVFLCGKCQPELAVEIILSAAKAHQVTTNTIIRGLPVNPEMPATMTAGLASTDFLELDDNQEILLHKQE